MNADWTSFTPWVSLAGGLLIGLAAALLVLLNGRIAGISGILGGLLTLPKGDRAWRVAFLLGLAVSPLVFALVGALPEARVDAGNGTLVVAGLLVGLGARYGSGCTSGHGVCGISRYSPRSLVPPPPSCWPASPPCSLSATCSVKEAAMQILIAFVAGLVFGIGLIVSGMTNPAKVLGFLDLAGDWDPSLAFVMGGAILIGLIAFRFASKRERSLLGAAMHLPAARQVDRRLVLGALTFGVGWGLAGYCPGPALASLALGGKPLVFSVAMVAGMAIFELLERLPRSRRAAPHGPA